MISLRSQNGKLKEKWRSTTRKFTPWTLNEMGISIHLRHNGKRVGTDPNKLKALSCQPLSLCPEKEMMTDDLKKNANHFYKKTQRSGFCPCSSLFF